MKHSLIKTTGICLLVLLASVATAWADHSDSTNAENDPIADLADLYVFSDPPCAPVNGQGCEAAPDELIVALTLNPMATGAEQFSEDVVYHFYFENDADVKRQVDCSFSADQVISCTGMGGLSASARVGEVGVNGDLRVYAGLRDDPWSWDLDAQTRFQTMGIAAYSDPGTDSFAGLNVLAIVIGIKITAMPPGATANHNVYKIWAASERTGGDGINGAISGTWYNPAQDGQGWVVEVLGETSGDLSFLSYFYGYDNNGEQLWLVTGASTSVIDGNTAVADVYRTSGTGFGGDFNPGSVVGAVVGTVMFEFDSCNSGTVTFTSADTAVLADFTTDIERLSAISSLNCALLIAGQVDRTARPLVDRLIPGDMRNDYNQNSDPDSWNADYRGAILASLNALATADGDPAWNGFYTAEQWADVFADDRIQIDVRKSQSVDFMTIERAEIEGLEYEDGSGRALDYDIHENLYNVLITSFDPFVDDFVDGNDVPFLDDFPFLAPPH